MIRITCPYCSEVTEVPDGFSGVRVRCAKCGQFNEAAVTTGASLSKNQKTVITFVLPLAIQGVLAIVHFIHERNAASPSPATYNMVCFATLLYTVLLFAVGVLSASSSAMESLNAKIKKDDDVEMQWFRQYLRTLRKWLPAYNTSFRGWQRMTIGGAVSAIYILALVLNGFVGTALTTSVSLLLIWLGMWIVRDSIKMAAEERERKAKKRAKAEMM